MKYFAVAVLVGSLTSQSMAHKICPSCRRCHACGRTVADIQKEKQPTRSVSPKTISTISYKPPISNESSRKDHEQTRADSPKQQLAPVTQTNQSQTPAPKQQIAMVSQKNQSQTPAPKDQIVPVSQETAEQPPHPPFSNDFNYPRQIDPQLQARAQREATLLAQYSFRENQRRWVSSNGALGHPIGVPAGYVGGTGCSWPEPAGGWRRTTANTIHTCEPGGPRHLLVAEAVAYNSGDGVWYASRIWKPY